ncbi:MAG TPA: hypothetical protein VK154_11620 [Chitinophagales bacterium]|nr:hypothetical protein [Chitinophagales bacterium]
MKRSLTFLSTFILLMFGAYQSSFAQDDVYYDPKNDPGNNTSTEQKYDNGTTNEESNATNNSNYTGSTDKTDGYGNPADKYDPRDNSSSYDNSQYSTDAGYYDEDYDSYFYTTRLRRYYVPNYGADYYSYWYTPSYFIGINTWNSAYVVSYSPWYQDPWWSWNRRFYQPAVVMYDPFWSWNFGWNTCAYYNSWSNPYYGGYSSWGYNGWGYNNGGFCGGYYNGFGYNNGYYNGYHHGYYDGYNNGYYNGYGNSAYNNNYYYHGPRHHRNAVADNTVRTPVNNPTTGGNVRPTDIPRQGITTPRNPGVNNGANTDNGVKVIAGTTRPYSEVSGTGNNTDRGGVKPSTQVGGLQNTAGTRVDEKPVRANTPAVNTPSSNANSADPDKIGRNGQPPAGSSWPFVQQKDPADWHEAPPTRWSNGQPAQQPRQNAKQPVKQPNRDNYNTTPNRSGSYGEQQRTNTPQNNNRVEPRTYEQPRVAAPNAQPQRTEPRSDYTPRNAEQPQRVSPPQRESRPQMSQPNYNRSEPRNYSAPQQQPQRNFNSPGPSNNGGGMRPGRR